MVRHCRAADADRISQFSRIPRTGEQVHEHRSTSGVGERVPDPRERVDVNVDIEKRDHAAYGTAGDELFRQGRLSR